MKGNILISVVVTLDRFEQFTHKVLDKLDLDETNIYMHVNLIGDFKILLLPAGSHIQFDVSYVLPVDYMHITNRQGRIGKLMSYRFPVRFGSIFLMDDDMEITDPKLFTDSLDYMQEMIDYHDLSFIKATTRPNDSSSLLNPELGYPWTGNGIMLRWMEYRIPEWLMDHWFYHDEWVLMKCAINKYGWRYASWNHSIGLVHHYRICDDKKIKVDPKLLEFLFGVAPENNEVNKDYMNYAAEYYNNRNRFTI